MKAVVVITDSAALPVFEKGFLTAEGRGFTLIPELLGRGLTGVKAGNRVHPGSSSLLLTVVEDADLDSTLTFVRRLRDEAGMAEATKIYVMPAEEG